MQMWKALLLIAAIVLTYANYLIFGTLSSTTLITKWSNIESEEGTDREGTDTTRQQAEKELLQAAAESQDNASAVAHGGCRDSHQDCGFWAKAGDCTANAAWVLQHCRESCGVCLYYTSPKKQVRRKVQLNNGRLMPTVGFGTAGLGDDTFQAVQWALESGYRLFDSAQGREWYREDAVGAAIAANGIDRAELFLTSKLHPRDLGQAGTNFEQSLADLGTSYLDLFLLHYPRCWGSLCTEEESQAGTWQAAWRELEALVDAGKVRAIGVSNFGLQDLSELVVLARVKPSVVQSHSDLFSADVLVQTFCARSGIQFQGYSTLGSQWLMRTGGNPVMTDPQIGLIASGHDCSPAQVAVRWALQHGQAVIPRSSSKDRMGNNLDVFDTFTLNIIEMQQLDAMDGTLGA